MPSEPGDIAGDLLGDICVVGAGPRGLAVAERIRANAGLAAGRRPFNLHIVDPYAGEGGKVWRTTQPRGLLMNTVSSQVTMFTDASVECEGPVCAGPSLYEWARGLGTADGPAWLLAETAGLGPDDYPTRAAYGHYLAWFLRELRREPGDRLRIRVHRRTAVALRDAGDGTQTITLDDGTALTGLAAVVLAQGHVGVSSSGSVAALDSYARSHGLAYLPPGNPADADLSFAAPGAPVAVRGLGLNFFDHMDLLTTGRGGRFESEAGKLVYRPSGREPVLYAGSRRGVPYHARGRNQKGATGRHEPLFLTLRAIQDLRERRQRGSEVHFRRDVWPLVRREVEAVYYTAMVSERRGPAAAAVFQRVYVAHAGPAGALLGAFGIRAWETWDWERLARPFGPAALTDQRAFQSWLVGYLGRDVERAERGNVDDPTKAALDVLRDLRNEVRLVVDHGGVTGHSYREDVEEWFTPLNAFASIGPPAARIKEMIALIRSGVLHMVGPGMWVDVMPGGEGFRVGSELIPGGETTVTALIEARMPPTDIRVTTDPLLRALLDSGQCRTYRIKGDRRGHHEVGGLAVTGRPYRIVDRRGRAHPSRFAFGLPTEGVHWATAAGIRPGVNSVILGDADAIARACLYTPRPGQLVRPPDHLSVPRKRGDSDARRTSLRPA